MEVFNLQTLITYILEQGGAGVISYALIAMLDSRFSWVQTLSKANRRYLAIAISIVIGMGTVWASSALGFSEAPASVEAWLGTGLAAAAVGQGVHAARELPKESKVVPMQVASPPVQ